MPDNPSVNQNTQIGVQSVFNTSVAATKVMKSFGIDFDPQLETDAYTPPGNIFPTSNAMTQEWVEGDVSGILTFTEIVYYLTNTFGPATITTPGGGTTSRQWKWTLNGNSLLTPTPFSVEKGNTGYGMRSGSMISTGLNFGWKRTDRVEMGGSVYGKPLEKGFTMTTIGANPTVPLVRVLPQQIDVYSDDTFGAIGTTKLPRAFEAGFSLDSLFGPVWVLNSTISGHDGMVPLMPDSESTMLLMADATGMAFLDKVRTTGTAARSYQRIKATGPIIEGAIPYLFQVDQVVETKDIDSLEDNDGVWAVPWTFQPIDDGTNPVVTITVVNTLTAL